MKSSIALSVSLCLLAGLFSLCPAAARAGEAKPDPEAMKALAKTVKTPDGRTISAEWDKTGMGDLPEPKDFTYTPTLNQKKRPMLLGFSATEAAVKAYVQALKDAGYEKKGEKTAEGDYEYKGFKEGSTVTVTYRMRTSGGMIQYYPVDTTSGKWPADFLPDLPRPPASLHNTDVYEKDAMMSTGYMSEATFKAYAETCKKAGYANNWQEHMKGHEQYFQGENKNGDMVRVDYMDDTVVSMPSANIALQKKR